MQVRPGTADDLPFMHQMLYEAAFWRAGMTRPPIEQALMEPHLNRIISGWGRAGDTAVVATTDDDTPVGAAWFRLYTAEEPSFGFIDEETPELTLAVDRHHRGQGVGTALMQSLIQAASAAGHPRLCLSVEASNPARSLYERFGFRKVDAAHGAWTMLRDPAAEATP